VFFVKGLSIKDVRSHGGKGGLSSADILQTKRALQMQLQTSALFDANSFEFFEIYGVAARARGEERSSFHDFVRTSFMDGPQDYIS